MPDVTATELARGVRSTTYKAPQAGAPAPPAFLVVPTTVGRRAVRTFHEQDARAARAYMTNSFANWLNHTNPSMRGNANNTIKALDTYIEADAADAGTFVGPGERVFVHLPSGTVKTKVDVVTSRLGELSGRAIFWDGQPITIDQAHIIAYPYAAALQQLYPDETVSDICIWQVRRGNLHVVAAIDALARASEADMVLARI